MRDYLSFRGLIRELESFLNDRKIKRALSHWKKTAPPRPSSLGITAHIMLIRDIRYVKLAEICVQSFLHHHPNATFVLHCDDKTVDAVNSIFCKEIQKNQLKLSLLDYKKSDDWQEQKLDLILRMSGTKDVFLDADLRWNGSLPEELGNALFLVKEFEFRDKSPFREILPEFDFAPASSSMKNVSVISFGGYHLTEVDLALIRNTMTQYRELISTTIVGSLDRRAIGRVIEQFTLSLCSETWDTEVAYVKESDKPLDGGIVESCYFGATGGTF